MRPVVGIECDLVEGERPYAKLYASYIGAVWRAGGAPILLPALPEPGYVGALLERIDAVLLTGGDDIDAAEFGQVLHPAATLVARGRYDFGRALLDRVVAAGIPCLGICYGAQLINVAFGGDIVQHIPDSHPDAITHFRVTDGGKRAKVSHPVRIVTGSRLHAAVGASDADVVSLHHQANGRLGRGLVATATASDGIVEAVELAARGPFLLGVQWHPEASPDGRAGATLFEALVAAGRARAEARR